MIPTGCNPLYVVEAAVHEGRILTNREPIEDVITQGKVTAEVVRSLVFVKEARSFARERGLSVGQAFSSFSPTDQDNLVWVVMGCKPDSFDAKSWWFPIVGSVPYKGFFSKKEALKAAENLQREGFETFVRGAAAFSTLGWFNDPVLTPVLRNPPSLVVNTIIHELVHRTLWLRDDVVFNESLANYLGHAEAAAFFLNRHPADTTLHRDATQRLAREIAISALAEQLYQELSAIYSSSSSREEKLILKRAAYTTADKQAKDQGLAFNLFSRANNAEFLQVYVYLRRFDLFDDLYQKKNADLGAFLDAIRQFQKKLSDTPAAPRDIFAHFEQFVRTIVNETQPRPAHPLT